MPPMESYNGISDPYDHIHAYDRLMRYYDHPDAAKCQMFVTTLKKGTRLWMMSLPPNSIGSWKELCDKFHDRFGSNKRRGKVTASLMQIKQQSNESSSQYVKRFREAVGTMTNLNAPQALKFFTTRPDGGKLMKDIMFNPPKDLCEAYDRVENLIAIDEAMGSLKPHVRTPDKPRDRDRSYNPTSEVQPKRKFTNGNSGGD